MSRINVLDIETVNKIAAGEVVERPASAVKELIENSIDAGATKITVEIKNGGISYIRVTDNGSGILSGDVEKAFLPHSTSKISDIKDLETLYTMGFRGEALSSISSVSHVDLLTKTKDELYGTSMSLEGGKVVSKQEAGCPDGTTIAISNLFYNTPARFNFLKKDVTEASHISDVVSRMIIGNPNVSIKYISSGREVMFSPGNGSLRDAYASVYGLELANALKEVNYDYEGIKVTGLVGLTHLARANRNMQDFYVNGRWVKSKTIIHAAEQAYKTMLMVGKYPILLLNISLDASKTDVNVHPSKLEIKFSDERVIHSAVFWAVQNAILSSDKVKEVEDKPKVSITSTYTPKQERPKQAFLDFNPEKPVNFDEIFKKELVDIFKKQEEKPVAKQKEMAFADSGNLEMEQTKAVPVTEFKVIGQIFNTFIIIQRGQEMLLIDQHAVHERINYNEIVKNAKVKSQVLLMPESILLSATEHSVVFQNLSVYADMGFEIEDFGENNIIVRSAPDGIDVSDIQNTIIEISDIIKSGGNTEEIYDRARFSVACKKAIKANHKIDVKEMEYLASVALNDDSVRTCPHGRPVVISFSRQFIEKQFKRIV